MNGGLIVDGLCKVNNVTINGGVLITGTGHLCLSGSLVNGGVSIQPKGDLDSNFSEAGCAAGGPNHIHGGVTVDHPSNIDFIGDTIEGTVKVNGVSPGFAGILLFSGVTLRGDLIVQNLPKAFAIDHNTITGSVHILDSGSLIEIGGNQIRGSLIVSNSTVSASGNTIGGSLQCKSGGKLAGTNTVHGANHC